jgi:HipA-like protein
MLAPIIARAERAAAQGAKAAVAEIICGELARLLGLPVPPLVRIEIDEQLLARLVP